jgi:hypothetical protein
MEEDTNAELEKTAERLRKILSLHSQAGEEPCSSETVEKSGDISVASGPADRDEWFTRCTYGRPSSLMQPPPKRSEQLPITTICPATGATYAVCCNSCDKTIPDAHYHCSTCDDGDFDLCQTCVDQGMTCQGDDHWLIKRVIRNGKIHNSTTETIAPKPVVKAPSVPVTSSSQASRVECLRPLRSHMYSGAGIRTCNSCVQGRDNMAFFPIA